MRQVTAICKTGEDAKQAMDALVESSFPPDDISILQVSNDHEVKELPIGQKTAVAVTLPTGMAAGAAVAVGLTLNGVLPGIGLVAVGPVLGALEAMALGGATGSLMGTLVGLNWWKADADIPAGDLEGGGILVGIAVPEERAHEAVRAFERVGAQRVTVA